MTPLKLAEYTGVVLAALLGAGGTATVLLPLIFGRRRAAVDTAGAVVTMMENQFKTVSDRYAELERRQHDTEQRLFEQTSKLAMVMHQLEVAVGHIERLEGAMRDASMVVPLRPHIGVPP